MKRKREKPDSNAGRKTSEKIPPEKLLHYRSIIEKKLSNPDVPVKTSYSDMTDDELKKEAKSKAIDNPFWPAAKFRR